MTWQPKPRNWRQYYGSRPSRSLTWAPYRLELGAEAEYVAWLAKERGWTRKEADAYCDAMDKRKLISQTTAADGPVGDMPMRRKAPSPRATAPLPPQVPAPLPIAEAPAAPRDYMADYEANAERLAATNVVPLRVVAGDPATPRLRRAARSTEERRKDAAALLRELAGTYGPRRAHKLNAMADFLETAPSRRKVEG